MKRTIRSLASIAVVLLAITLDCAAQDNMSKVLKTHEPYTITVALEFSKKNMNPMLRVLSFVGSVEPNAHATGFLVGDGLVMTSYHVVSGKLSSGKKRLLGFKPDDELQVKAYVNGCHARVVKVDEEADLALLRICTSKQGQKPTFLTKPGTDEQLILIAQPGDQKMVRRGKFNGLYSFRGYEYWSVKIDGQDGFSGSPVYNSNGDIVGVFCLYDWKRGVALLSPGVKAQQFLLDYNSATPSQP
jgi:S1-C subfamily serine protease